MRQLLLLAASSRGATTVEYGLIASLVSMTVVGTLASIGPDISEILEEMIDRFFM